MSSDQRRRLATAAAEAGYPGSLLPAIAQATLPRYMPGDRLTEPQLGAVVAAVGLLSEAGVSAEHAGALIGVCRERSPERWRERFRTIAVRAVRANARHVRTNAG